MLSNRKRRLNRQIVFALVCYFLLLRPANSFRLQINGINLEYEKHNALVTAIKTSGDKVSMLVVDEETDKLFKALNVTVTVEHLTGPLPTRQGKPFLPYY